MVKVNSEGRLESKEINVLRIYVFSKNKIQWSKNLLFGKGGSVTVVLLRSLEEKLAIFWDE